MIKWLKEFTENETVKVVAKVAAAFAAIITFVVTTLITQETFEKWKGKVEDVFSFRNSDNTYKTIEPEFIFDKPTNDRSRIFRVELPRFSIENDSKGEADSLYKALISSTIVVLKKDSAFNSTEDFPKNYNEFREVLNNHFPSPPFSRAIKITPIKETLRFGHKNGADLSGYICFSLLESSNATYSDTLSLNYINFDRKKLTVINLENVVNPFFINFAESFYRDSLIDVRKPTFNNDYFFLPQAFFLTYHHMHFQYTREKDVLAFQGANRKYELKIPLKSIDKVFLSSEGKLNYLLKSPY